MAEYQGELGMVDTSSLAHGVGLSPSALSLRNVETLLLTAQQQQLRHLRRLQQMRRQAELSAAVQMAWVEKQEEEERRRVAREAELKEDKVRRAQHHQEVAERNAAAQQAAGRTQEMWREALKGKLEAANKRTDDMLRQRSLLSEFSRVQWVRFEARRRRTYANHERTLEERRQRLEEKMANEERNLAQRQELRLIQDEIRREEEALAAVRREEARRRADIEAEARGQYYGLRAQQRDRQLSERKMDLEAQRAARAEEARQRTAYNQHRVAESSAAEQAKRDRVAQQLQSKMNKVDAIMAQREALVKEVQRVQAGMAAQEERMRSALEVMERTGKWHLPTELVDSTAALQSAMMELPLRSPGRSAGGGGRLPASGRPDSAPSNTLLLEKAFKTGPASRPGSAPPGGLRASRHEAELQRVLEEEILREMGREQALAQEPDHEERKRMIRHFAAEREAAKSRILAIGSGLAA
ncbi:MAG: hypothetical protein J3K34DRAFT_401538 [Monoraphidium minutum]|nr:MAG: hypothetical protein J3K34DRAFT_401538 [Monoraphidium minutum]